MERDRLILAELRFLGIEKGKPLEPDARQKKILEEAVVLGEAIAKANMSDKIVCVQVVWFIIEHAIAEYETPTGEEVEDISIMQAVKRCLAALP